MGIYFLWLVLVVACFYDYRSDRIPNKLVLFGGLVAILYRFAGFREALELSWILHTSLIFLFFYLFFKIGTLGAGDVKLLALAGAFLNLEEALLFIGICFGAAAVAGAVKLLRTKEWTTLHLSGPMLFADTGLLFCRLLLAWEGGIF